MSTISIARERSLYTGLAEQNVSKIQRDLSRLREKLSTGKRVNRPSDDPDSFAMAERMETLGNQLSRHEESIAAARPFVNRTQQELEGLADLFAQAQERGVQAENDSMSDDDRADLARALESLKDEVVDRLNARHNGEYLFAGNRTKEQPFTQDGEPNFTDAGGNPTHTPISGERQRPIGQDQTLTVNITGKELHQMGGGQTITGALDNLIEAVDPSATPSDIQGALEDVINARDHVLSKGAKAGTIGQRLSVAEDQLQAATLNAERRQSEAEDADLAKVASDLQQKQTQLQAALKAVATTQQTSLLNHLS